MKYIIEFEKTPDSDVNIYQIMRAAGASSAALAALVLGSREVTWEGGKVTVVQDHEFDDPNAA